ncbi:efflux RND transporter periplasmic adaptor subunit [Paenibacillus sp. LHD-117]|uniref:efflux RND transporter periplasmic adaptor subunit n=1 Tax=Paenibacillus sp. LHD-117 TaxID=3071412 RepID=UPI0027DF98BB|nr:efflux RND transporter periplasmic adaptor subunit [Paenibacillus sp. LHD-117]MDQ6420936.1 efflux RND transporter periplasmic adaptor subunit [Paenibacillus sp. LHD-117]
MKKWMIGVGIVLIVAAAGTGGYYYWNGQRPAAQEAEATSLSVNAARGNIVVKVSGSGSVAAETKESVQAGMNGTISELSFKVGDKVKAGQVLAVFEQEDVSSQIDQTELNIKKQELQMEQYEKQYKEAAAAAEADESSLASIELNIEMLKLEMANNEDELAELREQQAEKLEVKASIDGVVTVSEVAIGDTVQANAIIAEIVDYDSLTFNVQVDELDMPQISEGQAAQVYLTAFPDKTYEGEIKELAKEGSVSGGVAAYEVAIALKDLEGVLAGMSGQADMIIASREDVIVVPVAAVVELMGKTYVRVPGEGGAGAGGGAQGGTEAGAAGGTGDQGGGRGVAGTGTGTGGGTGVGAGTGAGAASGGAGGQAPAGAEGATRGQAPGAGGSADARMNAMASRIGLGGQLKEVTVGVSDETYVEIVSGLAQGDTVLVPLPQGAVGTGSASNQQQMMFPGGMGGVGGMNFPSGGMGGGQGGGMRGAMTQSGGAR